MSSWQKHSGTGTTSQGHACPPPELPFTLGLPSLCVCDIRRGNDTQLLGVYITISWWGAAPLPTLASRMLASLDLRRYCASYTNPLGVVVLERT